MKQKQAKQPEKVCNKRIEKTITSKQKNKNNLMEDWKKLKHIKKKTNQKTETKMVLLPFFAFFLCNVWMLT